MKLFDFSFEGLIICMVGWLVIPALALFGFLVVFWGILIVLKNISGYLG